MNVSLRMKAILVLIGAGFLGGIAPLLMKIGLTEFSSYQILFIRFGIATIMIIPLLISQMKMMTWKKLRYILPSGLLFSGNVFFFVVGVQYTTSIVSQLLYLLTPVLVSFVGYFAFREKISLRRIISMIICFIGSSLLIMRSIQGSDLIHSIGTFQGNILVLCAVTSWSFYVIYSKKVSKFIEPSLFLVGNFSTALLVSCVVFFITKTSFIATLIKFSHSDFSIILSLFALGSINSVLFFFLYQWGMKHVSAFAVASTTYLSPLSAALFAIPFFGEQLSSTLIISAASIFLGSYLILSEKK